MRRVKNLQSIGMGRSAISDYSSGIEGSSSHNFSSLVIRNSTANNYYSSLGTGRPIVNNYSFFRPFSSDVKSPFSAYYGIINKLYQSNPSFWQNVRTQIAIIEKAKEENRQLTKAEKLKVDFGPLLARERPKCSEIIPLLKLFNDTILENSPTWGPK